VFGEPACGMINESLIMIPHAGSPNTTDFKIVTMVRYYNADTSIVKHCSNLRNFLMDGSEIKIN
jgi:hypothetical protein